MTDTAPPLHCPYCDLRCSVETAKAAWLQSNGSAIA